MKLNKFALAVIIVVIVTTLLLPYTIMASNAAPLYGYGYGGGTSHAGSHQKQPSKDFHWVAGGSTCTAGFEKGGGTSSGTVFVDGDCIGLGQVSFYVDDSCTNPVVYHNGAKWFPVFYSEGRVFIYAYSGALPGTWQVVCE